MRPDTAAAVPNRPTVTFKTLRSVDVTTLGTKPLELSPPSPEAVHFANANGGLRLIDPDEVRSLAAASARRLLAAGLGVE